MAWYCCVVRKKRLTMKEKENYPVVKDKCLVNTTTIPRPILFLYVFVYILFGASVTIVTKRTTKSFVSLEKPCISKFDVFLLASVPNMLGVPVCFNVLRYSSERLHLLWLDENVVEALYWVTVNAKKLLQGPKLSYEMHCENDKSIGVNGQADLEKMCGFPGQICVFEKRLPMLVSCDVLYTMTLHRNRKKYGF